VAVSGTFHDRVVRSTAALLLSCGGCEVGEPLIDREPPTVEVPPPGCTPSACDWPDQLENAMPAALVLEPVSCPSVDHGAVGEATEPSRDCAEPAQGADWRDDDVILYAKEPREVVIAGGAAMHGVRIVIDGPVTLIVRDVPALAHVQISSSSPEAEVVLEGVDAEHVVVGDAGAPFAGHILLHHSRIDRLSMVATSLELDASMITESFVSVATLNSGDGAFRDVVLEVGHALLAPSQLEGVRITRCGTLSFFGATVRSSIVPRCTDEPTRLYDTRVSRGIFDGVVHADGGRFDRVQLGRHDASDYQLWDNVVRESAFCDGAERLMAQATFIDTNCSKRAFGEPDDVCTLGEVSDRENRNCCAALALETECPAPRPERVRPIARYFF
jgi:hypothetical protein